MNIERFQPSDLVELMIRPSQACMASALDGLDGGILARFDSYTGRIDGRVVACAGIMPMWAGRSFAWSVIAQDIGAAGMITLTRAVRRFLAMQGPGRIEATVVSGYAAGERWMRILGFDRETPEPMRKWLPDGQAAVLYSRVT